MTIASQLMVLIHDLSPLVDINRWEYTHLECLSFIAEKYGGWAPVRNSNQISRTARTALLAAALNDDDAKGSCS